MPKFLIENLRLAKLFDNDTINSTYALDTYPHFDKLQEIENLKQGIFMKVLIAVCLAFSILEAQAENFYDHTKTVCKNGNIILTVAGKASLFGSRTIILSKNNQEIINENYSEQYFPYDEHSAQYSIQYPQEYNKIIQIAQKAKPKSVYGEMDFQFRVSDNTILYQTYSSLNPKYGGETNALILEIIPTQEFIIFDINSQCNIKAL
jgi:hypothetical protein